MDAETKLLLALGLLGTLVSLALLWRRTAGERAASRPSAPVREG